VNGPTQDHAIIIDKIRQQLDDIEEIKEYCPIITPRKMKLFETDARVTFQTNKQQKHTILELNAHDRPGLLSTVSQVFLQCDIQLINAKLATLGDQVEDIFFITKNNDQPLNENEQSQLQQTLIESLSH